MVGCRILYNNTIPISILAIKYQNQFLSFKKYKWNTITNSAPFKSNSLLFQFVVKFLIILQLILSGITVPDCDDLVLWWHIFFIDLWCVWQWNYFELFKLISESFIVSFSKVRYSRPNFSIFTTNCCYIVIA